MGDLVDVSGGTRKIIEIDLINKSKVRAKKRASNQHENWFRSSFSKVILSRPFSFQI